MAKIYANPIERPVFDWKDREASTKAEQKYLDDTKAFLTKRNPGGKNVGEIIRFPVADSQAEYMVASMKPIALVKLEVGDNWDSETASYINAKGVQQHIDNARKLQEFLDSRKG